MSSILGKIPKFTLKLPSNLAKAGRTMSECPLELSFSLCDDGICPKNKTEEQIPLQVQLPQDSEQQGILLINKESNEKADEETSEKQQDNMAVTCSVSVDGQEKQEFSFTLYDFDKCDKTNKQQDVEKVVVRSICEALNKTLKLPPSGSRTIKVKLAISPDSSKESDSKDYQEEVVSNWPTESTKVLLPPSKLNDCCSAQSANTTSTYLQSSLSEKPPKYSSPSVTRSPQVVHKSSPCEVRAMPSPKLRPARYRPHKPDLKNHLKEKLNLRMHATSTRHPSEDLVNLDDDTTHVPKQVSSRDHLPECRDRRNHYSDLAGVESPKRNNLSHPNCGNESPRLNSSRDNHHQDSRGDPKYTCPYHPSERTPIYSKTHRIRDAQSSSPLKKTINFNPKFNEDPESSPRPYRTKFVADSDDIDLLNFNYDLNDLVPEAKFDWEKQNHRRSKSYDLHENNIPSLGEFYSPKLKPKNNQNWASILESQKLSHHLPSSPGHHYRHRHRDYERQRAMQQVASWIAREHSNSKADATKHFVRSSMSPSISRKQVVERHEHHHLHEHVHHHYHHFVD